MDLTALRAVLVGAQQLGFIGPAPLDDQVEHSLSFVDLVEMQIAPSRGDTHDGNALHPRLLDLGSGGGLPALVIASAIGHLRTTLLEGSTRKAAWLERAIIGLGLTERATVVGERAEISGHDPELRSCFDLVTARSFGPPAVVAECAAPFLRIGGHLLVSQPPASAEGGLPDRRWSSDVLSELGFSDAVDGVSARGRSFVDLTIVRATPERYPRPVGTPQKRPLF